MRLYIVRHGQAEARAATGRDQDRQLTEFGQRQASWLGKQFVLREDRPGLILHSPFVRTSHTARLMCDSLGCEIRVHESLACDTPASVAVDLIVEFGECGPVAFVAHNPQLDQLASALLTGAGGGHALGLRPGEAIVLDVDGAEPVGSSTAIDRVRLDG